MSTRDEVLRARTALLNGSGKLTYFEDRRLTRDTIAQAFVGYELEVYFPENNGQSFKGPALVYPCVGDGRVLGVHYKSEKRNNKGKRRQRWGGYADDLPRKGHGKRPEDPAKIIPFGLETLEGLEPGSLVVLCCGEEDALSLRQIGYTALSQPGAGLVEPVYARELAGLRCVVFYDAGEEAEARKDALKLMEAGAESVRVVEWPPDAENGADINEQLIENPNDCEKWAAEMIAAARPVSETGTGSFAVERAGEPDRYGIGDGQVRRKPSRKLPFKTAREIAETAPEEVRWCVRPWAARGAITEVSGPVKRAGKTTLVTHMGRSVVDGRDFMGEPTERTKVLYLTEQQPSSFTEALQRANLLDRDDFVVLFWHDTIGKPWHEVARTAADEAVRIGAGILVVDTLGQFASLKGDAENNAGAALEAIRPLQEAATRGLAVILVRHDRKGGGEVGESGRGSSAFAGAVDIIVAIRRGDGNTRPTVRKIEALSRFSETPSELVVELKDGSYRSLGTQSAVAANEAREAILGAAPASEEKALTAIELFEAAKANQATGNRALKDLLDSGELRRTGAGKKGSPYRYWRPDPAGDDGEILSQTPRTTKRKHSGAQDSGADFLSFQTSTPGVEERKERNLPDTKGEQDEEEGR